MSLHGVYISHVIACSGCHAPTARYCQAGQELRADYLVGFIMSQADRNTQRSIMISEKRANPHLYPLINERVRAEQEA